MNTFKNDHKVVKALKADKKNVKRFYKAERYAASFIGMDSVYLIKQDDCIIASAIVSNIDHVAFLHGLVTKSENQGQGLATMLLNEIKLNHDIIICFAKNDLTSLYQKNQFKKTQPDGLPLSLVKRYSSYQKKSRDLVVFTNK